MRKTCRTHGALFGASVLLLVLVFPAVLAAIPLQGQLTVSGLQAQGPSTVQAPLVAFFQEDPTDTHSATSPIFRLAAPLLHVQTYQSDPAVHPPSSGNPVDGGQNKTDAYYRDAFVKGVQVRPNHHWAVFPIDPGDASIQAVSTCAGLAPSPSSSQNQISKVFYPAPDASVTVKTGSSLAWTDCSGAATVTVTGNFFLMLWEWDAAIRANGQEYPLPSGHSASTYDPVGSPETLGVISHDRQRYLYVENGTLTVPQLVGGDYAVYLGPHARLHSDSGLAFQGATGRLASGAHAVDLSSSSVLLQGATELDASGIDTNQPFQGQLTGSPDSVSVDSRPLSWAAAPAGSHAFSWPTSLTMALAAGTLFVIAALALVAYPLWYYRALAPNDAFLSRIAKPKPLRERLALGYWAMARRAAKDLHHPRRALLWAQAAVLLAPRVIHHRLMRLAIRNDLGRLAQALRDHQRIHEALPHGRDRSRNACVAAASCCDLGRGDEALGWLRIAEEEDVKTFQDALLDASYDVLEGDSWFHARRQDVLLVASKRMHASAAGYS
jgi:hypothetical protein